MLDDSEDKHFSLKKIEERENNSKKLKGKKRKAETQSGADDFKIDVNDERFAALYTSHHFNIDPTDPRYKPTKATKELIEEKLRRRELEEVVRLYLCLRCSNRLTLHYFSADRKITETGGKWQAEECGIKCIG